MLLVSSLQVGSTDIIKPIPDSSYIPVSNYSLSPWTINVTLLESTVSPLLKVALHWMLVLLYSTDMFLKTSIPCLDS